VWLLSSANHRPIPASRRLSLFEQAQRVEGQHASGWGRYRIVRDDGSGSPVAVAPPAAVAPAA
jgi:hypothetical protein